jgi:hypothetical protein
MLLSCFHILFYVALEQYFWLGYKPSMLLSMCCECSTQFSRPIWSLFYRLCLAIIVLPAVAPTEYKDTVKFALWDFTNHSCLFLQLMQY